MNAHLVRLVIILRSRLVHKHRAKQALSMHRGGEGRKGYVHRHEGAGHVGAGGRGRNAGAGEGRARMNAHLGRAVGRLARTPPFRLLLPCPLPFPRWHSLRFLLRQHRANQRSACQWRDRRGWPQGRVGSRLVATRPIRRTRETRPMAGGCTLGGGAHILFSCSFFHEKCRVSQIQAGSCS